MLVRDVMSPNPAWIGPALPVGDASLMMMDLDLDCLPVKDNERLIGTITERDIAFSAASAGVGHKNLTVRDVMSVEAAYCFDSQDVNDASDIMRRRHLWGLPVFDHQECLVGTISLEKVLPLSTGRTVAALSETERHAKAMEEWIARYLEFHGGGSSRETPESGKGGFLPWTVQYLEFQSRGD